MSPRPSLLLQEAKELGLRNALFRIGWEARQRLGLLELLEPTPRARADLDAAAKGGLLERLPFAAPPAVREHMLGLIPEEAVAALGRTAAAAEAGRLLAFGRRMLDYGHPLDWHRNPDTGERWDGTVHWSRVLRDEPRVGDVKLTLEAARFPHAYHLSRAAALGCADAALSARVLDEHVAGFVAAQGYGKGVHWCSSQEAVLRLMAWLFGRHVFARLGHTLPALERALPRFAFETGTHVARYIDFARRSTFNNHLLCEALGLLLAGRLLPGLPESAGWCALGLGILVEQADRQVYEDGAYILNSHNYHRVAAQELFWASRLLAAEDLAAAPLARALERSLEFLFAQQNPKDGRLPNYGANDGSLVSILSCCDFSDFRPTLQALSLATRGERLYEPGPWDEEAAWLLGPERLLAPRRAAARVSASFAASGYHVLRGRDGGSFACLRCGSLRQRFAQIDMLHLDVWWRGQNVLVDGGSYLYNGPARWHEHFMRSASHNTLTLDGRDQMLHLRRFKVVRWTRARSLGFADAGAWVVCSGEHFGYAGGSAGAVHRRSVLFLKDDLWIVCDRVAGAGVHDVRLHWLCGEFAGAPDPRGGGYALETPEGPFRIEVLDMLGRALPIDAVSGAEDPPRGWLSRYYSEKVPVPSLAVALRERLPLAVVSILAGGARPSVTVEGAAWSVTLGRSRARFRLDEGREFADVAVEPAV